MEGKSHIVHDCVDTGKLSQEDHDVGVNDGAASTRDGDEVEPSEATGAGLCGFELVEDGVFHDEEFFPIFLQLRSADAFPDIECFKGAALVHEEAGRFGHEEHAHQHDGGEDEGGAEHVTPAAALEGLLEKGACGRERPTCLDIDKDGSHDIAKDLTQSDIELIERD